MGAPKENYAPAGGDVKVNYSSKTSKTHTILHRKHSSSCQRVSFKVLKVLNEGYELRV
jgi:hypothetical protein